MALFLKLICSICEKDSRNDELYKIIEIKEEKEISTFAHLQCHLRREEDAKCQ